MTEPRRLIAALEAAGFQRIGGRDGVYVRLAWPTSQRTLIVPLNPNYADYADLLNSVVGELRHTAELGGIAQRVLDGIRPSIEARIEASSLGTPDAVAMRTRTSPEQARRVVARAHGAPCCDLHGRNCEPPSELCCWRCSEASHDMFPIRHGDGTVCVLEEQGDHEPLG